MDDDHDCLNCGYCRFCIDASIATAEEMEAAEVCDYCDGTGVDDDALDDGTEDYDRCPICGGIE